MGTEQRTTYRRYGLNNMLGGAGGGVTPAQQWYDTVAGYGAVLHWSAAGGNVYTDTGATTPAGDGQAVKALVDPLTSATPIQATTANAPILRASVAAFNNQPALEFGGDDLLRIASGFTAWNTLLGASQHAIYIVGQYTGFSQYFLDATDADGTPPRLYLHNRPDTLRFQAYMTDNAGVGSNPIQAFADTDPHLYARIRHAASSTFAYMDGTPGAEVTANTGAVTLDTITIGATTSSSANLTGYICDIIAFGADGVTNRLAIEAAINERYALWV